jgi:hypothetical protein
VSDEKARLHVAIPTDRGHAFLTTERDGTTTVEVALSVENDQPVNAFAWHVRSDSVVVDPDVAMVDAGSARYTRDLVEVFIDPPSTVHVANPAG